MGSSEIFKVIIDQTVDGQVIVGWCEEDGAIGIYTPQLAADDWDGKIYLVERMLENLREWKDHTVKFGYKTRALRK